MGKSRGNSTGMMAGEPYARARRERADVRDACTEAMGVHGRAKRYDG